MAEIKSGIDENFKKRLFIIGAVMSAFIIFVLILLGSDERNAKIKFMENARRARIMAERERHVNSAVKLISKWSGSYSTRQFDPSEFDMVKD